MRNYLTNSCPPPPGAVRARIAAHAINEGYKFKLIENKGFTLAETLITLGIIGIVAAIILPPFVDNYRTRVRVEQDRSVKYKLTKATDQMKSQGLIGNYNSTEAFVQTLKKHLKIAQICSNDNLTNCWPTKTILTSEGKEINVEDLKTGTQFGTAGFTRNNVGIVTADGTPIIMSFKDDCDSLDPGKTYTWSTVDNKPVTNATTNCIAMIFDINGKGRPNQANDDVRLFNVEALNGNKECIFKLNNKCYTKYVAPVSLSQAECLEQKDKLGIPSCPTDNDFWAGSIAACGGIDHMPSRSDIQAMIKELYGSDSSSVTHTPMDTKKAAEMGLPTNFYVWGKDEYGSSEGMNRRFSADQFGSYYHAPKTHSDKGTVCVK